MEVRDPRDGVVIATMYGELDLAGADLVVAVVRVAMDYGRVLLLLDLRGLEFLDTSVIRVLYEAHLLARSQGGQVVLVSPQPEVRRTIEALGLTDLPVSDDRRSLGALA